MVAGMAMLGVGRNAILFMAGWEVMAIGAFLSITTEDQLPWTRDVGYLYLIATRVATLCVIAALALLVVALRSSEIEGLARRRPHRWPARSSRSPRSAAASRPG